MISICFNCYWKACRLKNGVLTIRIYEAIYAFNKPRLEKAEYREVVNEVFSKVLGEKINSKLY